jgi:hypothetical protein
VVVKNEARHNYLDHQLQRKDYLIDQEWQHGYNGSAREVLRTNSEQLQHELQCKLQTTCMQRRRTEQMMSAISIPRAMLSLHVCPSWIDFQPAQNTQHGYALMASRSQTYVPFEITHTNDG